jgi:hypothetical protein
MQIIPLAHASSLQTTLWSFQRQLVQKRAVPAVVNPVTAILPFCTSGKPLAEHTRNVISDICDSFGGVARMATSSEGQAALRGFLSETPQQAEDVIAFWQQEYMAD